MVHASNARRVSAGEDLLDWRRTDSINDTQVSRTMQGVNNVIEGLRTVRRGGQISAKASAMQSPLSSHGSIISFILKTNIILFNLQLTS